MTTLAETTAAADIAAAVRDGEDDEPGPEYWGWLIEQAAAGGPDEDDGGASEVEL